MNFVERAPVCLVAMVVISPLASRAQTLEAESAIQLPRAVITDNDAPANVVGQAFFSGATTVDVALKYGDCPVVLRFANGVLVSSSGGYFNAADCTGTPYFRASNLNPSPLGTACGYFLVNLNRGISQVFSTASKSSVTFNSRLNSQGVCESWGPEAFMTYVTETPKIGDLDDLFTPPLKIVQ